jgi:DNA polymerase bacteriophage-type
MLFLDFETRSQCDLPVSGLRRYAEDPTTQAICMSYKFDDDEVSTWWAGEPFPDKLIAHFAEGGLVVAHNASFDRAIMNFVVANDYGFEPPKLGQWRCSMTAALTSGLPAGLGNAAEALGLPAGKDKEGARLIRDYSVPGHLTEFKDGDADLMQQYCETDVLVMQGLWQSVRPLSDDEWAEYALNERVNDRGIPVDVEMCNAVMNYADEISADADQEINDLTGGVITKHTQRKSRDAWVLPMLTHNHLKLLTVYRKGEKKISFGKECRAALLAADDLDPRVRAYLEYVDNAGSSALKKYAVARAQEVDGRVHSCLLFNGAQTGRFSGRVLQPHNFRRDAYGENEAGAVIADILEGFEIARPANTMARLLRSMIAHDDGLYWVDWSAIEGRVAPWLSDSKAGERKLDIYRAEKDVYVVTAAGMFSLAEEAVDAGGRQSGKIAELSLQFGGGAGALMAMARGYGVVFEDEEAADIVSRWRRANPWAADIWSDFDRAISRAVLNPGEETTAGRLSFMSKDGFLWCCLPSGRMLAYPRPLWEDYETPWGEVRRGATFQMSMAPAAGEPPLRRHARGALLFQNAVQATAADILREALVAADEAGLDIILSVHDEVVGIGPYEDGEKLNAIMLRQPAWAAGLPLATGGVSSGRRYGK